MRYLAIFILTLMLGAIPGTVRADADSDGDGQTDAQELAAGTDPANELSVVWRHLTAWRFEDSLNGDGGQGPLLSSNVFFVPGVDGKAVDIPGTNGATYFKFLGTETNGHANLAPKRGSIWFYLKPHWFSNESEPDFSFTDVGVGPGEWATIFETENFRLSIDPQGTNLVLTSTLPGGGITTNIVKRISIRSLDFRRKRTDPGEELWHAGLLTYSPTETRIWWVYPGNQTTGPGIAPSSVPIENRYFSIGAGADGTAPVKGALDEVITFNAVGGLSTNSWKNSALATNGSNGLQIIWTGATNTVVNVKRREHGASVWQPLGAALGTNFFDATAVEGVRYEYNLNTRMSTVFGDEDKLGETISAARNAPPVENRGALLLLVDRTLTNALEAELSAYVTNLVGDGWQVIRAEMPRHVDDYSTATSYLTNYFHITNAIMPFVRSNYAQLGTNIKQMLIFGHVTVPYTGTIADDGHYGGSAPHQGAWATDLVYGDVDGIWTDTVLNTFSLFPWNLNYPGDGKFDQNFIPANTAGVAEIEIPVCRIDFANMTAFPATETELLSQYLRKNAAFRHGQANSPLKAATFETPVQGTFSLIPASTASAMASMLGPLGEALEADPFALAAPASLVAAVSGPGGFENLNFGMPSEHSTAQIAAGLTSTNIPFYFVRASYSPDWNSTNNFLRAILGTTNGGLTAATMYRERAWRVGGLAVGHTLGSDLRSSINSWPYTNLYSVRTMEILGDATLRHPAMPTPGETTWAMTNNAVYLNWSPPAGITPQYNVYRSTNGLSGPFARLNNLAVSATAFTDLSAPGGRLLYMVRAIAKVETGAGTYTNISQASFADGIPAFDPSNCCIADQFANEDTAIGPLSLNVGEAESQSGFQILVSSTNTALVPETNVVVQGAGAERTVTVIPATNQFGTTQIILTIFTDQAVTHRVFSVTVNSANDAPSFVKGTDRAVGQSSGARTITGWASNISPGPANESDQSVSFTVTTDKAFLFSAAPAIDPSGTLTFTPAATARGSATVTVRAVDTGGTANSGQNTSAPQTFVITIGLPDDEDADGLPDDYENTFGLASLPEANAAADTDGDGFSNLEELHAGTHPLNSASLLEINRTRMDGGAWRFAFSTVQGRGYAVEFNDTFPAGNWQTLFSNLPGFGSTFEIADVAGHSSHSNRIYRIRSTEGGTNVVYSGYAGFWRLPLLGLSDTMLSMPFIRPPVARGVIEQISGATVQIKGAPSWTTNQWAYSSGAQSNSFLLLIASGAMEGAYFTIEGNTSNQVSLDLDGGTMAGIAAGDRAMVVPYWTMGTIFPGATGVHASSRPNNRLTEVLFPSLQGSGINLAPTRTMFYINSWLEVGHGLTNKNDDVVLPEMFVWVRHRIATNTEVTAHGIVLPTKLRIPIRRRAEGEQDIFVALPRPAATSLNDSGLFQSGAFRPTTRVNLRTDELQVYRADVPTFNRAPSDTYFYFNNVWLRIGSGTTNMSQAPVFAPGGGAYLRLDPAADSTVWVNPPNY